MSSRILVAVVGVPLLILIVLWAPDWAVCAALCALAALAGVELQRCVNGGQNDAMTALSAVLPVFTILWGFFTAESPAPLWTAEIMLLFAYAISRSGAVKFEQIAAALFAGIAIAYSFASFLRMDAAGLARAYLLLPFVLSFSCDSGAYLAGRAFGRRKLAPVVSPHKTVEGAIGGLAGNLIGGLIFTALIRYFHGGELGYFHVLTLSLVCGVISQVGDLSFSLIKRQYGVKDYGRVFLSHGGVLDRFDSVLFVAPVVEFALLRLA